MAYANPAAIVVASPRFAPYAFVSPRRCAPVFASPASLPARASDFDHSRQVLEEYENELCQQIRDFTNLKDMFSSKVSTSDSSFVSVMASAGAGGVVEESKVVASLPNVLYFPYFRSLLDFAELYKSKAIVYVDSPERIELMANANYCYSEAEGILTSLDNALELQKTNRFRDEKKGDKKLIEKQYDFGKSLLDHLRLLLEQSKAREEKKDFDFNLTDDLLSDASQAVVYVQRMLRRLECEQHYIYCYSHIHKFSGLLNDIDQEYARMRAFFDRVVVSCDDSQIRTLRELVDFYQRGGAYRSRQEFLRLGHKFLTQVSNILSEVQEGHLDTARTVYESFSVDFAIAYENFYSTVQSEDDVFKQMDARYSKSLNLGGIISPKDGSVSIVDDMSSLDLGAVSAFFGVKSSAFPVVGDASVICDTFSDPTMAGCSPMAASLDFNFFGVLGNAVKMDVWQAMKFQRNCSRVERQAFFSQLEEMSQFLKDYLKDPVSADTLLAGWGGIQLALSSVGQLLHPDSTRSVVPGGTAAVAFMSSPSSLAPSVAARYGWGGELGPTT